MKKILNRVNVVGRVYSHNLTLKVTGPTSKKPGTPFIGGSVDIATDNAGVNIVTVNFTYVTETTAKGTKNETFTILKDIIDNNKTVLNVGAESAKMIQISSSLGLNDFYTSRSGEEQLVSAKRCDGGFIRNISFLPPEEDKRNYFEVDMLINGVRIVEANPEKGINEDYMVIKGAVFNFRGAILPVEFFVKSKGGMDYFESLDITPKNMVFTKVWGNVNSQTIVTKKEEEAAFGEAAVTEYERRVREWVVTGAARELYDLDDEQTGITPAEIKKALEDRETYLADVKRRAEEWRASQSVTAPAASSAVTAAQGGFNF